MKKLLFFAALVLIFFHSRGFISHDEGLILFAASRFYDGQVPYKDFQSLYFPGVLYLLQPFFFLFGESIASSRILAFINSLTGVALLYFIGKKMQLQGFVVLVLVGIYLFWGPAHINFVWPVMLNITAGLGVCFLLFLGIQKRKTYNFLLAGVLTGINLLLKQNFGFALLLFGFSSIFLIRTFPKKTALLYYLYGFIIICFFQLFYLLTTGSLVDFLSEFYSLTIVKILKEGTLKSPFPWEYAQPVLYKAAKTVFYLFPFLISLVSIVVCFKKKSTLWVYPLFVLLYYIVSIRPTTDYLHLTPLIAISGLSFAVIHKLTKKKYYIVIMVMLLFFGAYSSFYKNFYRWDPPIVKHTHFLSLEKAKIWVVNPYHITTPKIVAFIKKHTKKSDYIYVYAFSPMYYFLSERRNPTKYDYVIAPYVGDETIDILERKKIQLILVDNPLERDPSKIGSYIRKHYVKKETIDHYSLWIRR